MTGDRRRWTSMLLAADPRRCAETKMIVAILIYLSVWFVAIAWAVNPVPEPVVSSIEEHAPDLMKFEWVVILGLLGLVQALIAYVYLTGIKSLKDGQRHMFGMIERLQREKLDKDQHADTDHSNLCAVCKNVEVDIHIKDRKD